MVQFDTWVFFWGVRDGWFGGCFGGVFWGWMVWAGNGWRGGLTEDEKIFFIKSTDK